MYKFKYRHPVLNVEIWKEISTFNVYSSKLAIPANIIIDTEDVVKISKCTWMYGELGRYKTPRIRNTEGRCLEHYILDMPSYKRIIHKNSNNFDFRKSNLDILE